MIAALALATALLVAAIGAIWDIRSRRIPNVLCAVLAVAALASLVLSQGIETAGWGFLHGLIALLAGMLLFRLGMIGGGDAKFYAAAALGIPLSEALPMLFWTSIGGLGLLLALMVTFAFKRRLDGPRDKKGRVMVPYGVAIFIGFVVTQAAKLPGLSDSLYS
ncbi:A24 family peptidase [Allopontixanthobacter sp.]|uniref:A24 family peptidase n=1 Tax=Allopontixanthobacter sp. TaxID=2906452 RepID=UPI002AB9A8A7|nr:prepilin peptidase [Allopontixanthobacter sp.]MDZ4306990.1 prepilin peptidase [Allopontixanthobacter sp.]